MHLIFKSITITVAVVGRRFNQVTRRNWLARTAAISWVVAGVILTGGVAAAQCTGIELIQPPQFSVGGEPTTAVAADFDGDGIADLAVSNKNGRSISIIIGDGAGGFAPPINFTLAMEPESLAVGDFNKDGKADVAVGHAGNGPVFVLFGDGAGRFSQEVVVVDIPAANQVVVGDFNGDTNADIAVSVHLSKVRILLGNGNGGFSVSNVTTASASTPSLVAADFDGDGVSDLAFISEGSGGGGVSLIHGTREGDFSVNSVVSLSQTPKAIAAADFNGDGRLDAAVTAHNTQRVLFILLNDGARSFGTPTALTVADEPRAVATADFNGDEKMDVAVGSNSDHAFFVFLGDGLGNFTTITSRLPSEYPRGRIPVFIVARDFNSDGDTDIVATNRHDFTGWSGFKYGSTVSMLLGNGAGGFDSTELSSSTPCIYINNVTVTEGDAGTLNAVFTVRLSTASAKVVRVNYWTTAGNTRENVDYVHVSGRLAFQPGEISKTVSVPIIGDLSYEDDENLRLSLGNPAHATINTETDDGFCIIKNNDPVPTLFVDDVTVVEGDLPQPVIGNNFTISLSVPSGKDVIVHYATGGGTATAATIDAANDYVSFSGRFTIPAGRSSVPIPIWIYGDTTFEPNETFFLNLTNPTGATIGDAQGMATIIDDDSAPALSVDSPSASEPPAGTGAITFNVRLSSATNQMVRVNYATSDGTAVAGSDYTAASGSLTFAPLETNKTVTVTLHHDTLDEVDETLNLTLTNVVNASLTNSQATGLIRDNDGPIITINDISIRETNSDTAEARFTVSLSARSPQDVQVIFSTANGTATSTGDYLPLINSFLTVAAGATSGTLVVPIIGDTTDEPDETFFVNLTSAVNGTIGDAQGVGAIVNDDGPLAGRILQFSVPDIRQNEGDARATFTITRTGDTTGAATVDYRTTDSDTFTVGCADTVNNRGGAYARCDFARTVGKLSFAAGEINKTVSVSIIDDAHAEGAETFQLRLSNATGALLGERNVGTVTITDNDSAAGQPNPIFSTPFFVRQHYFDFLSREPEAGEPWSEILNKCPNVNDDPSCDRIKVSQSFYGSPEFQMKGFYVFRFYRLAFNRLPEYAEFIADMSFTAGLTPEEVYARKAQLSRLFAERPEFQTAYGGLTNDAFVSALLGRYQIAQINAPDPAQPDGTVKVSLTQAALINQLNLNTLTRAQVLRAVADSDEVRAREFNHAFVAMQYYGYLQRTPEAAGYEAWLGVLQRGDTRTMINGFMNSAEYKLRFGGL
jgi:hypothetical protein